MAEGTKTSALAALTGANLASTDLIPVVDVSDTTMAASGTNKKMTAAELAIGIGALIGDMTASEILTALLTVDGPGSGLNADLLDGVSAAGFDTAGSAASAQAAAIAAAAALVDDLSGVSNAAAARTALSVPKVSAVAAAEGDALLWDSANSQYSPRKVAPGLSIAYGLPPVTARALHPFGASFTAAADQQTITRLRHYSLQDIYDIRLVYVNSHSGGITSHGTFTLEAAVENVYGVIRRVTFNGAPTVTMAPGGVAVSDPVGWQVAGPANGNPTWGSSGNPYFFTRQMTTLDANGGKTPRIEAINTGIGECCETGTGLTNKVMSGSIATTGVDPYGPAAIVGVTAARLPVVFAIGDSIVAGTGDSPTAGTPGGYIMRALYAGKIPSLRHGIPSQQITELSQSDNTGTDRGIHFTLPFLAGCSHVICEYGINDLNNTLGNQTVAQLQARWILAWKRLAAFGAKVYQTTLLPTTTSSDSWATVGNQTVTVYETNRVDANNWIRDGAPLTSVASLTPVAVGTVTAGTIRAGDVGHPLTGYFEAADVAESARDSGKWVAGYTSDGTHPNSTGAAAISVAIDTSVFAV